VSDHHDGENTLKRLMECHLPRGKPPKEKKGQPTRHCVGNIKDEGEKKRNCILMSRL
jgi:hypothetical protein